MKKIITTVVIVAGIILSLNAFTIKSNDGKFVGGVCNNGDSFFVEKKGPMYVADSTSSGFCSKTSLTSAIKCACRE